MTERVVSVAACAAGCVEEAAAERPEMGCLSITYKRQNLEWQSCRCCCHTAFTSRFKDREQSKSREVVMEALSGKKVLRKKQIQ